MATPNIPNSLRLHAAGRLSADDPPLLTSLVNIASVVRDSAGVYTITMGVEIDPTEYQVVLTNESGGDIFMAVNSVAKTALTFEVNTFDQVGNPDDSAFFFTVLRTAV